MRGFIKIGMIALVVLVALAYFVLPPILSKSYSIKDFVIPSIAKIITPVPELDKILYDKLMMVLAHNPVVASSTASSTVSLTATSTPKKKYLWPAVAPYPNAGALLPFNRILAYYGNFYSTKMGVLGEYPHDQLIAKLNGEVEKWHAADPSTPVIPAIQYIAVTAQASAGKDGKYRLRMPTDQIDKALNLANEVKGILIIDIQVGKSTLAEEMPLLADYLKLPNVHFAVDPEFYMKYGDKPGSVIGTMDATDVNFAAGYLAKIVKENNLPPKLLVIHRFTDHMVTHSEQIRPLPEVQVVMEMDGWGSPARKKNTYLSTIYPYPVQFTGIKLFYKNDLKETPARLLTTDEVMNLRPIPSYIQYQ